MATIDCDAKRAELAKLEAAYGEAISGGAVQSMSYAGKGFTRYKADPRAMQVEIARLRRELNRNCGECYELVSQRVITLVPTP